jgi:hypothetical protein
MTQPREMMGLEIPGDQKVPVPVRDWNAMKLALWRSKVAWEIAMRAAVEIIARCQHEKDCHGEWSEIAPCFAGCPDREQRMSALVILNAGRQFAPVDARKPADAPYFAPSREYFSDVLATLATTQAELEALRVQLGSNVTPPPISSPQLKEAT